MNTTLLVLIILLVLLAIAVVVVVLLLRRSRVDPKAKPKEPLEGRDHIARTISEAVTALRKRVAAGKPPMRVPWVLLMGAPDTGKTTLLNQLGAGLFVPSPATGELQWRFLERGAVIDVPGAFLVTADGKAQSDGRWERTLRQLLRHRPSLPLNGVVLTVSASQLNLLNEAQSTRRNALAAAIRTKLDELQNITGLLVPVYVLVTKCDQIQGFGNFCWAIDPTRDDDIFGWSNPNTLESAFSPDWVNQAFDEMQDRLLSHQMRMFGARAYTPADDDLFVFPLQFDAMRIPLRNFLNEIFHETAYVDSNFLRGIYFCGDSSAIRDLSSLRPGPLAPFSLESGPLAASPEAGSAAAPSTPGLSPGSAITVAVQNRKIAFARDLFNLRVFLENRIAQPVSRIQFSRRRMVLAAQLAIALFAIIFSIGTTRAYTRLANLKNHRFVGLLNALSDKIPSENGGLQSKTPSVETAYDLVDTLGALHASGFESFFLPASWGDPLDHRISQALANAFSRTVFPAISNALDQRARTLIGSCAAAPVADQADAESSAVLSNVSFETDPQYLTLQNFVNNYGELQTAISHYDNVRRLGTGGFADLDYLFEYLIGKNLNDADAITSSSYYQRALERANSSAVPVTREGYLGQCARKLSASPSATSLVGNFYTSWFDNNPLLAGADHIAEQIGDLQSGKLQSNDDAAILAQDIRMLDGDVSSGAAKWLTQPSFDPNFYPALGGLLKLRFADSNVLSFVDNKGAEGLNKLKEQLYSTGSSDLGTILQQHGAAVQVSGDVVALEVALDSLLHQDFATGNGAPSVAPANVVWNKAALAQAQQLEDSYTKFIHDQMPLLPPSLRTPVQRIAAQNLDRAVLGAVVRAAQPGGALDPTTAFIEIHSFADAVPLLTRLQDSLPADSSSSNDLQNILRQQCTTLMKWLNSNLAAQPPYPYAIDNVGSWTGATPLTEIMFKTDTRDALEQYLAAQRDHVHTLATDYAAPLASYLQSNGLQTAAGFDQWFTIIKDVNDYDAKKPGNPIAALETFIRTDLDKITPGNGCQPVDLATRSSDYFVQVHANLENAGVKDCSQSALSVYANQIAGFFNAKLAGKFPFGPLPTTAGTAQADPYDVSEFLSRMGQWGPALEKFFAANPDYASQLTFVQQADGVRQMFAGSQTSGPPYADVVVYFRVNQDAEKNGNEIIDWVFQSGDQIIHFPGTQNSVRWHYGDTVNVTFRYAKDSPDIPRPGAADPQLRVDGRSAAWNYTGPWSLFALLNQHTGLASDFNATPDAMVSTAKFAIPTLPDTSRERPPLPAPTAGETVVYIRFGLRVPDVKEPRVVPIVAFPTKAPQLPSSSSSSAE